MRMLNILYLLLGQSKVKSGRKNNTVSYSLESVVVDVFDNICILYTVIGNILRNMSNSSGTAVHLFAGA